MSATLTERQSSVKFHPFAWWGWAVLLALVLFISNKPWFAAGLILGCSFLVRKFRGNDPWSRSFSVAMRFISVIISIRMLIAIVFGVPIPGTTLITLPTVQLPEWIAGIRLGGAVTSERLTATLGEVMIIAGVVALFATATSLTSPHRLIRSLPLAFYQLGLILTIATSVFPQLVISIKRIKSARRMRGQNVGGIRQWRKIAMPLLEDALERSLDLAAAMESRGFGQRVRRTTYRPDLWGASDTLLILFALLTMLAIFSAQSPLLHLGAGLISSTLALLTFTPSRRIS